MTVTIWNVFRAMAGLEYGRRCRSCAESILAEDRFGMSEGVCRACRSAPRN